MTAPERSARRRLSSAFTILLVGLLLAGCGVREDDSPRALAADAVPPELTESAPASTVPEAGTTAQRIYVLETRDGTEEVLAPYAALMPRPTDTDQFPRQVIEALVSLRPGENATFTTAIPNTTSVLDVRLVAGPDGEEDVLEINLNQLEGVTGPRLKLAIAQMVFTATGIPGVRGVRFLLNGIPVAVPLDVGESPVGAIVTKADFPQTNPSQTTTTTTVAPPAEAVPVEPEAGADQPATEVVPG